MNTIIKPLMMAIGMMSAVNAFANHTDSVYVRPDIKDGDHSMYIAYSTDKKHWKRVDCKLFDGDYGPWGSQKKIFYPVLSYDGKMFHATFFPDPKYLTDYPHAIRTTEKYGQIATTESEDFCLWKPQDYPFIKEGEYKKCLEAQKAASASNIISVPYSAVKALEDKARIKAQDAQWESENYIATAAPIAQQADSITVKITARKDDTKKISDNLMGIFFEDISYAADGGLYAELIQNRDFEYTAADHKGWDAQTAWSLKGEGITMKIVDGNADGNADGAGKGISKNNPHYALLSTSDQGGKAALVNEGWDGIAVKAKAKYSLSMFIKGNGKVRVSLVSGDKTLASCTFNSKDKQTSPLAGHRDGSGMGNTSPLMELGDGGMGNTSPLVGAWGVFKSTLTPIADATDAKLVIEPLQAGDIALDFISLFPKDTFHGHANGLRKDLAQTIADMHPRFVRFPGGCASHGQGIDNIYRWKATVGDLWDRQSDMNIWHYHQTRGLGFYEYFQFCEDLGAEPLPVLAAGVPCQNSWAGGNGQNGGIPWAQETKDDGKTSPKGGLGALTMQSYLQELLDLIEWANGDAKTSSLAQMRAKAGHPKPFNLKYLGIGNEDLLCDTFRVRYEYLINNIKKAHPEITIVGTVGPFWEGSDYEYGWRMAKANKNIDIVDEHYYNSPGWYFHHRDFYDNYDANGTGVYLGEWASHGTNASNALIEAAYLTNVERNADKVRMASYAPLLAKDKHTNWNPSLIYFDNTSIHPTANYYVQRAFGQNSGDTYVYSDAAVSYKDLKASSLQGKAGGKGSLPLLGDIQNRIDKSIVVDSKTGDIIVKIVSLLPKEALASIELGELLGTSSGTNVVTISTLSQPNTPDRAKAWAVNDSKTISVRDLSNLTLPAWSVTVIRIAKSK